MNPDGSVNGSFNTLKGSKEANGDRLLIVDQARTHIIYHLKLNSGGGQGYFNILNLNNSMHSSSEQHAFVAKQVQK